VSTAHMSALLYSVLWGLVTKMASAVIQLSIKQTAGITANAQLRAGPHCVDTLQDTHSCPQQQCNCAGSTIHTTQLISC